MKSQSIEQMKQTLDELIKENEQLRTGLVAMRQFRETWELDSGIEAEISADDEGNWYPSIQFKTEHKTEKMVIQIHEGCFPNRTLAKHKCRELYEEYADLCGEAIKGFLSPEMLPNAQVHPVMRKYLNKSMGRYERKRL